MFIIGVFGTPHATLAQVAPGATVAAAMPASAVAAGEPDAISDSSAVRLTVGRSTLIDIGAPISRVSLTSADVADALVTSPSQLLVHGKVPGAISMFVWNRGGSVKRYEIVVQRDLARLNEQIKTLFPGERHPGAQQRQVGRAVRQRVAQGSRREGDRRGRWLRREEGRRRHAAAGSAGPPAQQVLLRVRFAEVSRSAITELGVTYFTSPTGVKNTIGRIDDAAVPGADLHRPGVDEGQQRIRRGGHQRRRQDQLQRLPEPVLLQSEVRPWHGDSCDAAARSVPEPGRAEPRRRERQGGELPRRRRVPGSGRAGLGRQPGHLGQFKEFGIRLNFTPTVSGDRVHLKVRPEVSTLDFGNAVVLNGFRIPALTTRRTETEIELRERPDVRDRGSAEQPDAVDDAEDSGHRRHPDPRPSLPQQGGAQGPDRAGRHDHARDSAGRLDGRDQHAAAHAGAVHAAAAPRSRRSRRRRRRLVRSAVAGRRGACAGAGSTAAGRTLDASERAALAAAQQIEAQQRAAAEQQRRCRAAAARHAAAGEARPRSRPQARSVGSRSAPRAREAQADAKQAESDAELPRRPKKNARAGRAKQAKRDAGGQGNSQGRQGRRGSRPRRAKPSEAARPSAG